MADSEPFFRPEPSLAERVFTVLQDRILDLQLSPGARISEADVAAEFGISRQPVRDAFHRLSKLGFLDIRPQRATVVSLISPQVILEARFFRTAAEVEMVHRASARISPADMSDLEAILERQRRAVEARDTAGFKAEDDAFHRRICAICGLEAVWHRIAENKAHTDRLRLLAIRDSSPEAMEDHRRILEALAAGDGDGAAAAMRLHLGRIRGVLEDLRASRVEWFAP